MSRRRLEGDVIRQILAEERFLIEERMVIKTCCCLPYKGIVDFDERHFSEVSPHTRLLFKGIIPVVTYLFLITIGVTCLYAWNDGFMHDDSLRLFFSLVPSLTFMIAGVGVGVTHAIGIYQGYFERVWALKTFYEKEISKRLEKRLKIIEDFLDTIGNIDIVPPRQLAKLVLAANLSKESDLLHLACVREFKEILEECEKAGFRDLRLTPSKEALRALLLNPPDDPDRFHELVLNAAIETEGDLYELRSTLPHHDKRLKKLVFQSDELDSAHTSDESLEDAKNDGRVSTIVIGNERIEVDIDLLRQESKWFASYNAHEPEIVIPSDAPHKDELIQILRRFENFSAVDDFFRWIDCMVYYRFERLLQEAGIEVLCANPADPSLTLEQEMKVAYAVASEMSQQTRKSLQSLLIAITNNPVSKRRYESWVDFGFKKLDKWVLAFYTGHVFSDVLKFNVLAAVVKRRELFPASVMNRLREHVQTYFLTIYQYNPFQLFLDDLDLTIWLAGEMRGREEDFFELAGFRQVWQYCSGNPIMKKILIDYASKHKLAVLSLWDVGTVPNELTHSLPI